MSVARPRREDKWKRGRSEHLWKDFDFSSSDLNGSLLFLHSFSVVIWFVLFALFFLKLLFSSMVLSIISKRNFERHKVKWHQHDCLNKVDCLLNLKIKIWISYCKRKYWLNWEIQNCIITLYERYFYTILQIAKN